MTNNELADLLEEAARRLRGDSPRGESLQLYTQRETARLLRISMGEVDRHIKPFKLSERRKRYRASDIEAFIKSKEASQ